jgi:16S rRNA (cytosine967-C5)-methyltransferase
MLDRIIDAFANGRKLDPEVRIVLRLAIYQLKYLDRIPAHAAVNDAVNLTIRAKKTSAKGLVNALLRKFQKSPPQIEFADDADRLSVETSHPAWLIDRWTRQFGAQSAKALARFGNQQPDLEFRWTSRTTDADRRSVAEQKGAANADFLRELAENGKIYFQDRGSQIVTDALLLKDGETMLDVCAAPGGKSTLAALRAAGMKLIVAGDISAARISTLAANCRNQGASDIMIVRFDAVEGLPFADASFDVVFVDAPCSGTGTIRHNPEIRYSIKESDFERLACKQRRMLENASKLVRPGGRIVYATCSLELEENEAVCADFLRGNPNFRVIPSGLPKELETLEGYSRTTPFRDALDGFFVAVFEKL